MLPERHTGSQRCGAQQSRRPWPSSGGPGCGACPVWVDPRRHGARWHEVSRRLRGTPDRYAPASQTRYAAFAPGEPGSKCALSYLRAES